MKCIELEMSYRGSRNYLHGTDIYPSVMAAVERERTTRVEGPVSLMFKNFSDYQLDMFLFDPEEIPDKPTNAMVFFSIGDNDKSHGWLVKSTRPVKERRAFDEIAIDRQTLYTDKKASVQANLDLPPIDIIVPNHQAPALKDYCQRQASDGSLAGSNCPHCSA